MKRCIATTLACVFLSMAGTAFAADSLKIASVDPRKIAQESKIGVEATKSLSKTAEKLEKSLKAKEAELQKIKDALQGKGPQLTAKERTAKEKDIQKKLNQYREAAQDAQKQMLAKEEEFGRALTVKMEAALKEYAPKNGYAVVIRKGDLLYSDGAHEVTDITDDILKIIGPAPKEPAGKK